MINAYVKTFKKKTCSHNLQNKGRIAITRSWSVVFLNHGTSRTWGTEVLMDGWADEWEQPKKKGVPGLLVAWMGSVDG